MRPARETCENATSEKFSDDSLRTITTLGSAGQSTYNIYLVMKTGGGANAGLGKASTGTS
jgi:hypothetical protein